MVAGQYQVEMSEIREQIARQRAAAAPGWDLPSRATKRWYRFFLRLVARKTWHWEGVLCWPLGRKHLLGWPTPRPSTETVPQYIAQSGYARSRQAEVSAMLLGELVEYRTKVGLRHAFVGHPVVERAIQIAIARKGAQARVKAGAAAAKQAQISETVGGSGASASTGIIGFGPRGGLPRDKPSLRKLCRDCGLSDEGTVPTLRTRLQEFVAMLPKTEAERRIMVAEAQENAERNRELAAAASRSGPGGSSASAPQPSVQQPSTPDSQPPMEETLRRMVQEAMSQQASAAGAATPSSEQLQSLMEGTLTNLLGANPRAAMNDAATEAATACLTQADSLLKRLTENAEFLTNQQRVAMETLSSLAMATNSAPGQGIVHPNQNLAPAGAQEVIVLDPSEEVEMTAAEEVELQAALLAMSAPPAQQN